MIKPSPAADVTLCQAAAAGTVNFAGVDALRCLALGPKDDLEGLANSLLKLYHTKLPWCAALLLTLALQLSA